jgi:hypothetical protein
LVLALAFALCSEPAGQGHSLFLVSR